MLRLTATKLCRKENAESGFRRFKNYIFDVEDKECSGALEKFKDEELEVLLHGNSCQTLAKLAESLGLDYSRMIRNI